MKTKLLALATLALLFSCSKNDEAIANEQQELPVKITRKNANGTVQSTKTLSYDNKKRLSEVTHTDAISTNSYKAIFVYEPNKIKLITNFLDASQIDREYTYTYSSGKLVKEEHYQNNVLDVIFTVKRNNDGTETHTAKNPTGTLLYTMNYIFGGKGNIISRRTDEADPSKTDFTITYEGYDNNPRAIFEPRAATLGYAFAYGRINAPLLPNNPVAYKYTFDGYSPSIFERYEYQYTPSGKVKSIKTLNALNSNELTLTREYEYQLF